MSPRPRHSAGRRFESDAPHEGIRPLPGRRRSCASAAEALLEERAHGLPRYSSPTGAAATTATQPATYADLVTVAQAVLGFSVVAALLTVIPGLDTALVLR